MKRLIFLCLVLAVAAGAQAQYSAETCYSKQGGIVCQSGASLTMESGSTLTIQSGATVAYTAGTFDLALAADDQFLVDANTTNHTGTDPAFEIDMESLTADNIAFGLGLIQKDGATSGEDVFLGQWTMTGNDANGDVKGILYTAAASTNATTATYEYFFTLDCAENTAEACTDGIVITSSGIDTGMTDAIDVSNAYIVNAINVGSNLILGANSDSIQVGATNNALTVTADSTNTAAIIFADAGGAANGLVDVAGAGALTVGSVDVTDVTITTDGGSASVGATANTLILTAGTTSTAVFTGADAADAANTNYDTTGAGAIDVGSADVTDIQLVTDGGSFDVGTTSNAASIIAAAGQTATLILADDAGAANGAVDVAGAGAITIGSADVTAVTITTDSTADGSDLVLPENAVSGNEAMIPSDSFIACGEHDENGTIYFGPATAMFLGDNSTSYAIGTAACDALDNATEGTADAPLTDYGAFKVVGMWCRTDATLGAGETIVFTARSAAADLTPTVTCTIGEAATYCRSVAASTTDVAVGATVAVKAVETSNNGDGDESWCRVYIQMQ